MSYRHFKGGVNSHKAHPEMAKEAGSKGGKRTVELRPELKTSEHGKYIRSFRKSQGNSIQFEISEQCLQCGESLKQIDSFCNKSCRGRYRERVSYYQRTYGLNKQQAIALLESKRNIREIRETIKDDRKYRNHKGPPYTHRPSSNTG